MPMIRYKMKFRVGLRDRDGTFFRTDIQDHDATLGLATVRVNGLERFSDANPECVFAWLEGLDEVCKVIDSNPGYQLPDALML